MRLARKELPGMVLMDMMMPAMNGLEAMRKIREERTTLHIPVVMLTSITNAETVIEALRAGTNALCGQTLYRGDRSRPR